jgi:uncharacterized protein YbcC (UPF0753/DUF2309 family)
MTTAFSRKNASSSSDRPQANSIEARIQDSWSTIAPAWPLQNLILNSPLKGLEGKPFETALHEARACFETKELPAPLEAINRQTLKYLTAFFDTTQAKLPLPMQALGLWPAFLKLAAADPSLLADGAQRCDWIKTLSKTPEKAISKILTLFNIPGHDQGLFLRLMLITLPGWASHIRYRVDYAPQDKEACATLKSAYLAVRLTITYLLWPKAGALLTWHKTNLQKTSKKSLKSLVSNESIYRNLLVQDIAKATPPPDSETPTAQLAFCIDVRSEPLRRHLEALGSYETFGCAGFFGIPLTIKHGDGQIDPSHPALFKAGETVHLRVVHETYLGQSLADLGQICRHIYASMSQTFMAPFFLSALVAPFCGLWSFMRTMCPRLSHALAVKMNPRRHPPQDIMLSSPQLSTAQKTNYAEKFLRVIGLTQNFAPLVVFCGHGSQSVNNPQKTSLDCGACGGHHGGSHARILCDILNDHDVRTQLAKQSIIVPAGTFFLAAEHNTATDAVWIDMHHVPEAFHKAIYNLKNDLHTAQMHTAAERQRLNSKKAAGLSSIRRAQVQSSQWANVYGDAGLVRNASLVVGPRWLTQSIPLKGRTFLHSYDPTTDQDGAILATILGSAMVVAQWINAHYFFSSLNPATYGSGSRSTQNVMAGFGVMQGVASDLMTGLSLEAIYKVGKTGSHETIRLLTVVYAPKERVLKAITDNDTLRTLITHQWIHLACCDLQTKRLYTLTPERAWTPL